VFARPDEQYIGELGIPNEDAQSFVFDAGTLFERDKFSGYDRMEGGTRVNLGLRYSGAYGSGWTTNAILGQSYQVGGVNSFAAPDLVNAGAFSGLETPTSDYVGLFGFATPFGLSSSVSARLDEQTFELRRAELKAGYVASPISLTAKYAFIQAQPLYGFPDDRHELTLGGSARMLEFWRLFASGTYDFQADVLTSDAVGFAYDDECFSYTMTYGETRNRTTLETSQSIGFNVSFRTIGDFGSNSSGLAQN
jgi:LPS-assembly protein